MKSSVSSIHMILQPQSGIGKKYIAFLLKQYLSQKFDVKFFSIQDKNITLWDELFEEFITQENQTLILVISSIYCKEFQIYLDETQLLKFILNSDKRLLNHYIFTPGRNGDRIQKTFNFICTDIKKRAGQAVVWENYNLGTTLKEQTKGQFSCLSELPEFKKIEPDINANILLPAESFYFKKDLSFHILSGQTFDQAILNSKNNLIYRQRLYQIKKRTFGAIENAGL